MAQNTYMVGPRQSDAVFKYTNITAGTGTVNVFTGNGVLHCVTINSAGTATTGVQLFDNTTATGTTIASISGTSGNLTYFYDANVVNGLTVNTATNSPNITVIWKQ